MKMETTRTEQLKPFRAWVAVQDKQGPMLSDSEDAPRLFPTLERLKWCVLCRLGDSLIYQCDPNSEFAQMYAEKRMRETGWRIEEVEVRSVKDGRKDETV